MILPTILSVFAAGPAELLDLAAVDGHTVATLVAAVAASVVVPVVNEWRQARKLRAKEVTEKEAQRKRDTALTAALDRINLLEAQLAAVQAELTKARADHDESNALNAMLATELMVRVGLLDTDARVGPPANGSASHKTRVLLVEDDDGTRRAFAALLKREGFVVTLADTLKAALAAVKATHYDAVVLDRKLPDGDGADVLKFLRRSRAATRVVITTGFETDDLKGLKPDVVIEKPVPPEDLFRAVRGE